MQENNQMCCFVCVCVCYIIPIFSFILLNTEYTSSRRQASLQRYCGVQSHVVRQNKTKE